MVEVRSRNGWFIHNNSSIPYQNGIIYNCISWNPLSNDIIKGYVLIKNNRAFLIKVNDIPNQSFIQLSEIFDEYFESSPDLITSIKEIKYDEIYFPINMSTLESFGKFCVLYNYIKNFCKNK
jgi:hypothetical protein